MESDGIRLAGEARRADLGARGGAEAAGAKAEQSWGGRAAGPAWRAVSCAVPFESLDPWSVLCPKAMRILAIPLQAEVDWLRLNAAPSEGEK
jgi:hypothetical protein